MRRGQELIKVKEEIKKTLDKIKRQNLLLVPVITSAEYKRRVQDVLNLLYHNSNEDLRDFEKYEVVSHKLFSIGSEAPPSNFGYDINTFWKALNPFITHMMGWVYSIYSERPLPPPPSR